MRRLFEYWSYTFGCNPLRFCNVFFSETIAFLCLSSICDNGDDDDDNDDDNDDNDDDDNEDDGDDN